MFLEIEDTHFHMKRALHGECKKIHTEEQPAEIMVRAVKLRLLRKYINLIEISMYKKESRREGRITVPVSPQRSQR